MYNDLSDVDKDSYEDPEKKIPNKLQSEFISNVEV
jgi:hypothetical protein